MSLLNVAVFQSKNYGKIPKISPSKKKPPQTCNPKNLSLPRDLYLKIALKYKVKQRKTVNFLPRRGLGQSILKRKFPSLHKPRPNISPSKRAFEKHKSWGLFSEFYGIRPHPSTRVGFCLKTETLHKYLVKTVTENGSFLKTLSRVEIFENAAFSFTCGRTKTEVFEYDDVTHHITSSMTYAP